MTNQTPKLYIGEHEIGTVSLEPTFIEEKIEEADCGNGAEVMMSTNQYKMNLQEAIEQGRKETNDEIQKIIDKYYACGGHLCEDKLIEDLTKLIK